MEKVDKIELGEDAFLSTIKCYLICIIKQFLSWNAVGFQRVGQNALLPTKPFKTSKRVKRMDSSYFGNMFGCDTSVCF